MALDVQDNGFIDVLALTNMKAVFDGALLDAQAHRARLQILAETALSRAIESQHATSVPEGLGIGAAAAANQAQRTSDLGAAIAALQQMTKGAQTTPPNTGS